MTVNQTADEAFMLAEQSIAAVGMMAGAAFDSVGSANANIAGVKNTAMTGINDQANTEKQKSYIIAGVVVVGLYLIYKGMTK